jgi:hypothetical protein
VIDRDLSPLHSLGLSLMVRDDFYLFDWDLSPDIAPTGKKPFKIARRRAEALNRLYRTDRVSPAHSVWFVKNHVDYLLGMERLLGVDSDCSTQPSDLADLQTIRNIISSSSQVHRRHEAISKAAWPSEETSTETKEGYGGENLILS